MEKVIENVEGYLLKNKNGEFLTNKQTWSMYNRHTRTFESIDECLKVKAKRPSSRVIEVAYRYTFTNMGMTKYERVERKYQPNNN
jgi:hypothetical protein